METLPDNHVDTAPSDKHSRHSDYPYKLPCPVTLLKNHSNGRSTSSICSQSTLFTHDILCLQQPFYVSIGLTYCFTYSIQNLGTKTSPLPLSSSHHPSQHRVWASDHDDLRHSLNGHSVPKDVGNSYPSSRYLYIRSFYNAKTLIISHHFPSGTANICVPLLYNTALHRSIEHILYPTVSTIYPAPYTRHSILVFYPLRLFLKIPLRPHISHVSQ